MLTEDERKEASLIRDELWMGLSADSSMGGRFKVKALEKVYTENNLSRLRLYRRYLLGFRPYDIDRAAEAKHYLGFPTETVDDECMALVDRFHHVLLRNRPDDMRAVDSQSMTILLRHVVANPDDLETILQIITERRARGYIEILATLEDMKSQRTSAPLQRGFL